MSLEADLCWEQAALFFCADATTPRGHEISDGSGVIAIFEALT